MKHCEDCGCKVFSGRCVNCNEVEYIEDQYYELDMPVPKIIQEQSQESRDERKRKEKIRQEA